MNNKLLAGISILNLVLVGWLLIRSFSSGTDKTNKEENLNNSINDITEEKQNLNQAHEPTGKIAFVNIDTVNEKSLFVADMVKKLKSSKTAIEASLESLQQQYQQKIKEYQNSASAGIAPESELAAKAKEIQAIEREAQNKQIQMDNLAMELNEKND